MDKEKLVNVASRTHIDLLNRMIHEAIIHGGDHGGAYFINNEALIKEMRYYLNWTGLNKTVGIMDEDGWVRFYIKSDIAE